MREVKCWRCLKREKGEMARLILGIEARKKAMGSAAMMEFCTHCLCVSAQHRVHGGADVLLGNPPLAGPIVLYVLLMGCGGGHAFPHDVQQGLNTQAREVQKECQRYYLHREWRLVYPPPQDICKWAAAQVRRGRVPQWRL